MKREGQIKVHSENMFPIIKKWLYSDKDIFLRELISNSCDAIKKLERLNGIGKADIGEFIPRIDVVVDKGNKTITVSDNGIGMTDDEVEKYITQIAFSGAEDFIKKYQDNLQDSKSEDIGIIGHFGLGFYSAYMVADKVEIETLSYKENSKPVHWESDGSETYTIDDGSRDFRGTSITLHISDDESEFLERYRINEILNKYCKFMPYEIYLEYKDGEKSDDSNDPINNTKPLWLKAPRDCTEEEYKNFYKEVFLDINDPLFWIHLNVDYPFNLKGILYFPKQTNKLEVIPGEIKLFSNQVYIADNIKEVVPEFLMLLKGVIDCPDLPLNVSRSFLQNDGDVAKISKHITKKVSDKLHSIFKTDRSKFESYWEDISPFIKYGCIKDEKFYDRVKDIILFKTINGNYLTITEFPKEDGSKIFYVTDEDMQAQYIKMFKQNGMVAAVLTHEIDKHFISFLEYKDNQNQFARIDSDISSSMKGTNSQDNNELVEKFKLALEKEDITVKAESLKSKDTPAIILLSEHERRMQEISSIYGNIFGQAPKASATIVLNIENNIIKSILDLSDDDAKLVCKNIYDLALLGHKQLSADEISAFTKRSLKVLEKVFKK